MTAEFKFSSLEFGIGRLQAAAGVVESGVRRLYARVSCLNIRSRPFNARFRLQDARVLKRLLPFVTDNCVFPGSNADFGLLHLCAEVVIFKLD